MYLTYNDYISYGGSLPESTFNQINFRVQKQIDFVTGNRVSKMNETPEAVKRCIFDLIQQEQSYDKTLGSISSANNESGQLALSFSTDGYSETYGSGGSTGEYLMNLRGSLDSLQKRTIQDYLAYEYDDNGVRLLYRGVC